MNDEIKEILDSLKDTADTSYFAVCGSQEELDKMPRSITKILSIPSKDAKILYNYITNLQEEKKELKKKITFNEKTRRKMQQSLMEQIEDYKSRNEKAIEYIDKHYWGIDGFGEIDKVKNILQGSDKDE